MYLKSKVEGSVTRCYHRTQVGRGTDRSSLRGRKRLKERGSWEKEGPSLSGVTTMNTLTLIKNQIEKAAALHDAQILVTKYRGVDCQVHQATEETHGTYCYRGRTYVK